VGNNQFIGFLMCGQPVGCTTGKALCGVGQYFSNKVGGETCMSNTDCASVNCDNGTCTASPVDFLDCPTLIKTTVSCTSSDDCPALVGITCTDSTDCPGTATCVDFGGAGIPGKPPPEMVCQESCENGSCAGPTCTSDSDCITFKDNATGTFMLCDTTTSTCVSTNASLLEAAGVNGQSCYISYYNSQTPPSIACGGCPTECTDPPCSPAQQSNLNWPLPFAGEVCKNTNTDWIDFVEPQIESFKAACPTAYSFPFDDPTSTFQCRNGNSNTTAYTITFCPDS